MFRGTTRITRITSDAAKKVLKEIFGKDPVDAADKMKQAGDKMKEAIMKSRQGQQLKRSQYIKADTFPSPVSFGPPIVIISGNEHHDPNAFFKTPSKNQDQKEPLLGKTTRHKSMVAITPQSYAPRLGDETPVNKILFE